MGEKEVSAIGGGGKLVFGVKVCSKRLISDAGRDDG